LATRAGEEAVEGEAEQVEVIGEPDADEKVGHEVDRRHDVGENRGEDRLVDDGNATVAQQACDEHEHARDLADQATDRPPRTLLPRKAHSVAHLCSPPFVDRKSTRLNSSHVKISYAVFCL